MIKPKEMEPPMQKNSSRIIHKIVKQRTLLHNGKEIRQYLVRYKDTSVDSDKWLSEEEIPNSKAFLRNYRAERREMRNTED